MTIAEFEQTPRYMAYKCAAKAVDNVAQARIMQEAIAQTNGEEKKFWLRLQENQRWSTRYYQQSSAETGWIELQQVLATAPTDESTLQNAVIRSVGIYFRTEQRDSWARLFPDIRPHLRLIKDSWGYYYNLSNLRLRQRRWRAAYLTAKRTANLFHATYPNTTSATRIHVYVVGAMAAVACGELGTARRDVEQATVIEAGYDRSYVEPYGLHLAQAELALAQGRSQAARTALQVGMGRATMAQHKPKPYHYIDYDLMAARIARAEGNRTSFEHFCEQALSRCLEWDLPFSEARVRAVMAGAER